MKKFLTIASLCLLQILTLAPQMAAGADTTPDKDVIDVYQHLEAELAKFAKVNLDNMTIEVDLTNQMVLIHDGGTTDETVVCAFPCSTGPGKYAMIPDGKETVIYETGKGAEGNRESNSSGVTMRHFVRMNISNANGTEAVVGFHSTTGKYVPRIPTTHGCVRLPEAAALALYNKVKGSTPGKVSRKVPVIYTGTTPKPFG